MRTYSLHHSNEYNNIVVVMIVTTLLLSSSIAFNQVASSSSSSNPATNNYYSYSSSFQDPSLLLKAKNTINGTKSYSNATSNSSKNGISSYIKNSTTNSTTSRVPHSNQLIGGNNANSIKNDKTSISRKLVILGFDDSLKSQYALAKPILDKYGFK